MINNPFACVFPGQGSQSIGMLSELANHFNEINHTFTIASGVLGYDLWQLIHQGPAEKLNETEYTQPALLASSYAIWQILTLRLPFHPQMLAGHSLGEYTALVCAQALNFEDAIQLVAARGRYMQEAVLPGVGAMAALIGLDEEAVLRICKEANINQDEMVAPANFNSLGQIVIAGHRQAVDRAILLAKAAGAKLATLLPVSVPSHCPLMEPAARRLGSLLETMTLRPPIMPVINNVNAVAYNDVSSIRDGLMKQLYSPVRWVEIIKYFVNAGITSIVECGPGKVLCGLNKRIDNKIQCFSSFDISNIEILLKSEKKI